MFHYVDKLKKNNNGSTFLLVIIVMMFIAVIGTVILSLSSDYLVTVMVDQHATENFYDAESVLAEVRTGLQEYASDSGKEAYSSIIENYKDTSGDTREDKYSRLYLNTLADRLGVTEASAWDGVNDKEYIGNIDKVAALTTKPEAVTSPPGLAIKVALENNPAEGYQLTLKNLMVDYQNEGGYRSTIKTDIVIRVPDCHFDGDTTLNECKKYIIISDGALKISNTSGASHEASASGATLTGNIYTGQNGIQTNQQTKAVFNSDMIISRGDFNVLTGSDVSIQANDGSSPAELWLQNVRISSNGSTNTSLYSEVKILADSYIANDFAINDDYSKVTLGGSYYGYSYNKENTGTTGIQNPDYSSAILVNGLNTTLLTPDLNRLILAGRAFISRNNINGSSSGASDIMTGESLAVKSNQIAYLVPNEFLTPGHNPLISTEDTNALMRGELLASAIGKYLNSTEPTTKNYISSIGGVNFVYYFLNFKDEMSANKYFADFYASDNNKDEIVKRAKTYISTKDGSGMKLDASLYLLAGNIIHNYYSDTGAKIQTANYYENTGAPRSEFLQDGISKGKEYVGRQMTLLPTSGMTMRLPEDAGPLVASEVIDFSRVAAYSRADYSELAASIVISPDDYILDHSSPSKGILVCKGNVTVQSNFEGLIIAGGSVTINVQGVKCSYNQQLVKSLMKEIMDDKNLSKYFINSDSFEGAVDPGISMSDYISYKNWSKNEL